MKTIVRNKPVLFNPIRRWVFSNPKTGFQVAVLSVKNKELFLSIPIEGMGGLHIKCSGYNEAWKIANRECYRRGKIYNRIVTFPWCFFTDRLT